MRNENITAYISIYIPKSQFKSTRHFRDYLRKIKQDLSMLQEYENIEFRPAYSEADTGERLKEDVILITMCFESGKTVKENKQKAIATYKAIESGIQFMNKKLRINPKHSIYYDIYP